MMDQRAALPTPRPESAHTLIKHVERVGIGPMGDPRRASRQAAIQALDGLAHLSDLSPCIEQDLRLVKRLVAVIAAINGPGEEQKH